MPNRYPLHYFLLLTSLLIFLTACQDEQPDQQDVEKIHKRGNTFVVQLAGDPHSLHPINSLTSAMSQSILFYTMHKLTIIDAETYKLAPVLAADLPEVSADGLVYTYQVHPDAQWDDGQAITAEDVVFSIKASCSPLVTVQALRGYFSKYIADLEVDENDPKRFRLLMKSQYVNNAYLADNLPILDKRFFDETGKLDKFSVAEILDPKTKVADDADMQAWAENFNDGKYVNDPALLKGTMGPYVVEEWIPGQQIILKQRENYWAANLERKVHAQQPDRIIFKMVSDATAIELQLKQDEIDVALRLQSALRQKLEMDSAFQEQFEIASFLRNSQLFVGFNMRPGVGQSPIFGEKAVRKAFSFTVPTQEIIDNFYAGVPPRIASPVPVKSPDYNQALKPLPLSLDSARAILEAAGWTDQDGDGIREKKINGKVTPLAAKLSYRGGNQLADDMVQRIIYQANQAGFLIEAKNITDTRAVLRNHTFDLVLSALSSSYLPYDFSQHWHTENISSGSNYLNFGNLEIDELIDKSNQEVDPEKRSEMVKDLQKRIYNEYPCAFICNLVTNMALHKRIDDRSAYDINPYVYLNALED